MIADAFAVEMCKFVQVALAPAADGVIVEQQAQIALAPCAWGRQDSEYALDDFHFFIYGAPSIHQLHFSEVIDEGQGDSHVPLSLDLEDVKDVNEEGDLAGGHEPLLPGQQGREVLKDELDALLLQFGGLLYQEAKSIAVDLVL